MPRGSVLERIGASALVFGVGGCLPHDNEGGAEDGTQDTGAAVVRTCPPPDGVSATPESIEDVVALLAALPQPTSLPCFLESLERPIQMVATSHAFSAQPSDSEGNPRMFIVSGPLTMTVVPTGIGSSLLEMAVDVGNRESLKAELTFPLVTPIQPEDPYDQIHQEGGGSTCNGCHGGERVSDAVEFTTAFVSEALQAPPDDTVSVAFVKQHATTCDPELEPARCELLSALFAHGEVIQHEFPQDNRICRTP